MNVEKSSSWYERAGRVIPGGISSNVRAIWSPVPMFYDHGVGSRVWDVDGNEYIDYVLARGPLLLGHTPKRVIEAAKAQLDRGLMYAGQSELEVVVAEKICELVPCAEMVRFSTSGSEAVHGALRLARGATGKNKILRFEGHYHGWFDSALWSFAPPADRAGPREAPVPVPTCKGQPPSDAENLVVLPWNDIDLLTRTIEARADELAAVITEPVMCNNGCILPKDGYLQGMRDACTRHGVVLIFDEVITGFRSELGGAQALFGVTPDLAVFAKGVAAGFPVSVIAGKRELMKHFGDLSVTHAGTYNSNPPSMAAAKAALEELSANAGAAGKALRQRGRRLMDSIAEAGRAAGADMSVRGLPAVFNVAFGLTDEPTDFRSMAGRDADKQRRFFDGLQERGVRITPEGSFFVSTAHTDEDVEQTVRVVGETLGAL